MLKKSPLLGSAMGSAATSTRRQRHFGLLRDETRAAGEQRVVFSRRESRAWIEPCRFRDTQLFPFPGAARYKREARGNMYGAIDNNAARHESALRHRRPGGLKRPAS
jgi:hypothetical protein